MKKKNYIFFRIKQTHLGTYLREFRNYKLYLKFIHARNPTEIVWNPNFSSKKWYYIKIAWYGIFFSKIRYAHGFHDQKCTNFWRYPWVFKKSKLPKIMFSRSSYHIFLSRSFLQCSYKWITTFCTTYSPKFLKMLLQL